MKKKSKLKESFKSCFFLPSNPCELVKSISFFFDQIQDKFIDQILKFAFFSLFYDIHLFKRVMKTKREIPLKQLSDRVQIFDQVYCRTRRKRRRRVRVCVEYFQNQLAQGQTCIDSSSSLLFFLVKYQLKIVNRKEKRERERATETAAAVAFDACLLLFSPFRYVEWLLTNQLNRNRSRFSTAVARPPRFSSMNRRFAMPSSSSVKSKVNHSTFERMSS